jgi:hypothetical protein
MQPWFCFETGCDNCKHLKLKILKHKHFGPLERKQYITERVFHVQPIIRPKYIPIVWKDFNHNMPETKDLAQSHPDDLTEQLAEGPWKERTKTCDDIQDRLGNLDKDGVRKAKDAIMWLEQEMANKPEEDADPEVEEVYDDGFDDDKLDDDYDYGGAESD